jgi:transposase-like protein
MAATTTDRSSAARGSTPAAEWTPPQDRERWHQADGEAMVAALRASGETPSEFALRHGVQEARVQRWVKRVERVGRRSRPAASVPSVTFAPVRVAAEPAIASGPGLEVVIGEAVVRVSRGFDGELLRRVVTTLGGTSC